MKTLPVNRLSSIALNTSVMLTTLVLAGLNHSAYAASKVSIDDDSFGVLYESPAQGNKGLILFISNSKCIGSYHVATQERVIASGELNARGPNKHITLGTAKFNVDCGPLQSLLLIRE